MIKSYTFESRFFFNVKLRNILSNYTTDVMHKQQVKKFSLSVLLWKLCRKKSRSTKGFYDITKRNARCYEDDSEETEGRGKSVIA